MEASTWEQLQHLLEFLFSRRVSVGRLLRHRDRAEHGVGLHAPVCLRACFHWSSVAAAGLFSGARYLSRLSTQILRGFLRRIQSAGVAPGCMPLAAIWLSAWAIVHRALAFEVGVGILLLPLLQKIQLLLRIFFFCDRLGRGRTRPDPSPLALWRAGA